MNLLVVDGDLLDQDVDAIVNAWNRNLIPWWLLLPQGVSGAIKKRAGYEPFRELSRKGVIPLGGAVITGAGRLPQKAIIHVAGINLLWYSTEESIRACVRSAMQLARENKFRSIAFPLIGAGTGGGKPERVLEMMKDELASIDFDGEVRIVRWRSANARNGEDEHYFTTEAQRTQRGHRERIVSFSYRKSLWPSVSSVPLW